MFIAKSERTPFTRILPVRGDVHAISRLEKNDEIRYFSLFKKFTRYIILYIL